MNKKTILICDDEGSIEDTLKTELMKIDSISGYFTVESSGGRFKNAIKALENRLMSARDIQPDTFPRDDAAEIIDSSSILIIDYDLIGINPSITGERMAYLARCYSTCGIIIALNQFPPYIHQHFDLTLRGHPESYADLNIPSGSLYNPGLWEEPWKGFRPWSWPLLPLSYEKYEKQATTLESHLDEPLFDVIGLNESETLILPRSSQEFVSKSNDPSTTTIREFVLNSGNGLRARDKPLSDKAIARIAAARLNAWLEYMILPSQNIVIDAPHLVSRYPSLLVEDSNNDVGVNGTATFTGHEALPLASTIERFRLKSEFWISRPVWFWNDVSNFEGITEVSDPWSIEHLDLVFCEDVSRYLPADKVTEFVADLESPFVRRFVQRLDNIQYTPEVRFAL